MELRFVSFGSCRNLDLKHAVVLTCEVVLQLIINFRTLLENQSPFFSFCTLYSQRYASLQKENYESRTEKKTPEVKTFFSDEPLRQLIKFTVMSYDDYDYDACYKTNWLLQH